MEHPHKHASLANEFRQRLRQWQEHNPGWEEFANIHPSQIRDERIRRRRQQICEAIAELSLGCIQRRLNEMRLPADMGHWEKFARSEATTMAQHAQGIHIPFERQLAELYEFIDARLLGHLATDVVVFVQSSANAQVGRASRHALGNDHRKHR